MESRRAAMQHSLSLLLAVASFSYSRAQGGLTLECMSACPKLFALLPLVTNTGPGRLLSGVDNNTGEFWRRLSNGQVDLGAQLDLLCGEEVLEALDCVKTAENCASLLTAMPPTFASARCVCKTCPQVELMKEMLPPPPKQGEKADAGKAVASMMAGMFGMACKLPPIMECMSQANKQTPNSCPAAVGGAPPEQIQALTNFSQCMCSVCPVDFKGLKETILQGAVGDQLSKEERQILVTKSACSNLGVQACFTKANEQQAGICPVIDIVQALTGQALARRLIIEASYETQVKTCERMGYPVKELTPDFSEDETSRSIRAFARHTAVVILHLGVWWTASMK
eukprot:TRINITY_DN27282_c0_g2_i1.p1 TRINITY_DN27282_c0_g2~~TRINITY_DN27282_c0_g2_i1.p1  ORF type:complete len:356 (-),score=30.67 TRINITY_DN27282_c0_g2_i1:149-1168(-)